MAGNDTFDGVHRPATNWVRVHLSPNHLFSAFHHASMSRQLEQEGDVRDRATTERHRASVVGAVLAATAFLEASINELFYAAGDTNVAHPSLDETTRKSFDALWSVDGFRRSARVLEKFEVALQLAGSVPLAKGSKPYQDARLLVDLRNALVHYVPSTFVIEAGASQDESLDEFGKKFRGKFEENPEGPNFGDKLRGRAKSPGGGKPPPPPQHPRPGGRSGGPPGGVNSLESFFRGGGARGTTTIQRRTCHPFGGRGGNQPKLP